jgi:ferrous iron transport protein B
MELPPYRFPTLKGLLILTWERSWQYIKKAGTVVLGISILLWAMMTYPGLPDERIQQYEQQRQQAMAAFAPATGTERERTGELTAAGNPELDKALQQIKAQEAMERLKNSIGGRIGLACETVSRYAGIDWRTNIALLGGFAAKEVIISTLGTAYSLGDVDPENAASLNERLAKDPGWNPVVALAVLVFIMFYAPCFVTVVCIAKEAGSWKWAAFSMVFNTVFAYAMAVAVYQIGALLYL